jgi:hypothetical protein
MIAPLSDNQPVLVGRNCYQLESAPTGGGLLMEVARDPLGAALGSCGPHILG